MLNVLQCLLFLTIYNFTLHGIGKIPSCPLQIYVQSCLTVPRHVTVTGAVNKCYLIFRLLDAHWYETTSDIFNAHRYDTASKICNAHCSVGIRLNLRGY